MTDTKILNLDDFDLGDKKTIVFKGKTHVMKVFTVKDFIELSEATKGAVGNNENLNIEEFFSIAIKTILRAFPTLTEEDLKDMPSPHIKAINDFIMDSTERETEEGMTKSGEDIPKN